jgi:dihydroneopterin aldolase/2-amino-4-hydroxy-6-hydroxymethyldihydropteridine diphosphokinase
MARAFVAIGSNIEPEKNVRQAIRLLARRVRVVAVSTVYRTRPLGRPEQDDFYNCVLAVETDAPPIDLKRNVLREIETRLGRTRGDDRSAPRAIDLDLILYDDLVTNMTDLTLPDPEIASMPFLATPLFELAPDLVIPGSAAKVSDLARELSESGMIPLISYTEQLRRDIAREYPEG